MKTIGATEVPLRFTGILSEVKSGESYTVTDDGRPVALIQPIAAPEEDRAEIETAVAKLLEFRKTHFASAEEIGEFIREGRRF